MIDLLVLLLCIIISNSVLYLFLKYYGFHLQTVSISLKCISFLINTCNPILIGVSFLPFEITTKQPFPCLILLQKVLYYLAVSLSFVVYPIIIIYQKIVDEEGPSLNDNIDCKLFRNRIICAIILQIVCVLILLIILLIAVYFIFPKSLLNIVFSFKVGPLLNLLGLLMFGLSMGFGMIYFPMQIILYSDPLYSIRYKLALIYVNINYLKDSEKGIDNILHSCNKDYMRLSKLKHKKNKIDFKEIVLLILGGSLMILSFVYLIMIEIFFCIGKNYIKDLFNSIQCNAIKQLLLFTLISVLILISSYSLTCIEIEDNKFFKYTFVSSYKFVPRCTNIRTFSIWTTFMQRIIPTIAYHCQMLIGFENSTYSVLMNEIDNIKNYRNGLELALIFELGIVAVLTFIFSKRWPNDNKLYREGYKIFKEKYASCNDYSIENWIIWDQLPSIEEFDQKPLLSISSTLSTDEISSRSNIISINSLNSSSVKTHYTHEEINAYFNNF